MEVEVADKKETVNVAGDVKCSKGGRSVPIIVTATATPHTDVSVSVVVVPAETPAADPYPS